MNIEAKQVKCGDCIVIRDKEEKLIVDCGSNNSGLDGHGFYLKSSKFAYNQLRNELFDDCKKSLLITHFHKDHFNGLIEIDQDHVFDNIYISPCLTREVGIAVEAIGQIVLLAANNSWGFPIARQIIDLINRLPLLAKDAKNINIKKAGDTFTFAGREFQVLWPEIITSVKMSDIKPPYFIDRGLTRTAEKIELVTGYDDENEPEVINTVEKEAILSDMERIKESLANIYRRYNINVQEQLVIFQNSIFNCMDIIDTSKKGQDYYDSLRMYLKDINISFDYLREQHDKLIKNRLDQSEKDQIRESYRYYYHVLVDSMNACSIVFSHNHDCLFMGDAPKQVIKHLRENKSMVGYYKVVKLQHHATIAYETVHTPEAECYIISNGGRERRKIGRGFIDPMPITGENDRVKKIICTNGRDKQGVYCEYYEREKHCYEKCIREMCMEI